LRTIGNTAHEITSSSGVKIFTATCPVPVALVTVKLTEKSEESKSIDIVKQGKCARSKPTDGRQCFIECHSWRVNFQKQVRSSGIIVNRTEVLSLAICNVVLLKGVERKAVFAGVCGGQRQSKHCAQASKDHDDSWEHRDRSSSNLLLFGSKKAARLACSCCPSPSAPALESARCAKGRASHAKLT